MDCDLAVEKNAERVYGLIADVPLHFTSNKNSKKSSTIAANINAMVSKRMNAVAPALFEEGEYTGIKGVAERLLKHDVTEKGLVAMSEASSMIVDCLVQCEKSFILNHTDVSSCVQKVYGKCMREI